MGSSCSSGVPPAYDAIDKPQSSIHSSHGSHSKRGHSSNLFPSSSEDSDNYSDNDSSDGSKSCFNLQTPDTVVPEPPPKTPTPVPMPRPKPVQPKIASLAEFPLSLRKMMCGRMEDEVKVEDKIIYVYHCANFSDSCHERTALLEQVYPSLREYCNEQGCELHVMDYLWGLRDEFIHGHMLRTFCLQRLREIVARDHNVIFTILLNEKYGNIWCPLQIDVDTVNSMMKKVTEDDKHFFMSWYHLDENAIPPIYVLQPIEWKVRRYGDKNRETYKEGFREWEKELIRLRNVLIQATGSDYQRMYCISAMEKEMEDMVFSGKIHRDHVLWIKRTFGKLSIESSHSIQGQYLDLYCDRLEENAQMKLKNLTNRLDDRMDPTQKISLNIDWDEEGINPAKPQHRKYLDKMCENYKEALMRVIDHIIPKKKEHDMSRIKLAHRGLSKTLQTDLIQNTNLCQRLCNAFIGREELIEDLEAYIRQGHPKLKGQIEAKLEKPCPLLLSGIMGSGKTSLAAILARNVCSIEGWTSSVCVFRSIAASIECETLEQMLMSIGEQLAFLCQLSPSLLHDHPITDFLAFLITKVPTTMPLLIVLDGLDLLTLPDGNMFPSDWLPRELPTHVRILLTTTTGSLAQNCIKKHLPEDAPTVTIPYLSLEEFHEMVDKQLSKQNRTLTSAQWDKIEENMADMGVPMTARQVVKSSVKWDNLTKVTEIKVSNEVQQMASELLTGLEAKFGVKVVERALLYLLCSRHGLSDPEINDLLSCYEPAMTATFTFHEPALQRMPEFVWAEIKSKLSLYFRERTQCGVIVTCILSSTFKDLVMTRYQSELAKARQELLSYFNREKKIVIKQSRAPSSLSNIETPNKKSLLKSQPLCWRNTFIGRRLCEVPYQLSKHAEGFSSLISDCLLDWTWLIARMQSSNVQQFLLDLKLGQNNDHHDDPCVKELFFLEGLLKGMIKILSLDPMQFGPQLYMKCKTGQLTFDGDFPMCKKMYDTAMTTLPNLLLPSDLTVLPCYFKNNITANPQPILTGLFNVKGDENHIISLAKDKGVLKIWNIHTKEVVRTMQGLDEPKDIKMFDLRKAVLLCNRELALYNLDEGTKLIQLKGVLNIRMPFFGIHDKDHTIAMARNRMYVNMMSNTTGEMVTTFKVGEDRFLNSLLVSEQGNVCVCGDAVQKPFPLLVWDLHARKLIYDLRIQGHEFLTKMAAISKGGEYVISVCREIEDPDPNFILVYDLQTGSVFKKWKRSFSTTSVAIADKTSLVISGHEDGSITVWELMSGACKHTLRGHSRGPDVLKLSETGSHAMSYDSSRQDTSVWFWDLINGQAVGCFSTEMGITCGEISADGSTIIVGLPGSGDIITLCAPGHMIPPDTGVFGDASRKGKVYQIDNAAVTQM